MPLLTFVIPVRHQANARDWKLLKQYLTQTIASISGQDHSDWHAVIVANKGADLPALPKRFSVTYVDFPPNEMHERTSSDKQDFYDSFRLDKGRRVLAGMLSAHDSEFFMIVDDDDFVSSRIVRHVIENRQANGWTIDRGYVWESGSSLMMCHDDFNHLCGTSLIIRADLYQLPSSFADASPVWIKSMLGSHISIAETLKKNGKPLLSLPFPGAIYRVGNACSHSQTSSFIARYFLSPSALRHPLRMIINALKLRWISPRIQREFFGA